MKCANNSKSCFVIAFSCAYFAVLCPSPRPSSAVFLRLTCLGVNSALGFQKRYMYRVMQILIAHTTRQLTFDHSAIPTHTAGYTFISNHRDIVLDSAFLDVRLIKPGFQIRYKLPSATICSSILGSNGSCA